MAYHLCKRYGVPSAYRTLPARRQAAARRLARATDLVRGSLLERFTQCGQPDCKCMRGEKHGPAYYFTVTYGRSQTRQAYVPRANKARVQRWFRNPQGGWAALEEISRINLELLRRKDPLLEAWRKVQGDGCGMARALS